MLQLWSLETLSTVTKMLEVLKPLQLPLISNKNYSNQISREKHHLQLNQSILNQLQRPFKAHNLKHVVGVVLTVRLYGGIMSPSSLQARSTDSTPQAGLPPIQHQLTVPANLNPHPCSVAITLVEKLKFTVMRIANLKLLVFTMAF